jgi:hypothetical protein
MNSTKGEINWHTLTSENSLSLLSSSLTGLNNSEAEKALVSFGKNQLPEAKPTSVIMLFYVSLKRLLPLFY